MPIVRGRVAPAQPRSPPRGRRPPGRASRWLWRTRGVGRCTRDVKLPGQPQRAHFFAWYTPVRAASPPQVAHPVNSGSTGAKLHVLAGHEKVVAGAAFGPDGKLVVTASWDATARIWDAETGHTRIILSGHTDLLRSAEFSPDSRMVITASWDDTARVWDATTGELIRTLNGLRSNVNSAGFSPDGHAGSRRRH